MHEMSRRGTRLGRLLAVAVVACSGLAAGCEDQATGSVDSYLARAENFREEGKPRASIIEIKNALQLDAANPHARYLLAMTYLDLGAWSAAEATLAQAVAADDVEGRVLRAMAQAKIELRKFDEVLELAHIAPDTPGDDAAVLHALRGKALIGLKRFREARDSFESALKADPSSVQAQLGLARLAIMERKLEDAEVRLAKAAATAPEDIDVLQFQAQYAVFKGDGETAERMYRNLMERRPARLEFRLALASVHIGAGQLENAVSSLDEILKASPNHPWANYLRSLAAYRAKDYAAASAYGNAVLKVDNTHAPTLRILGAAAYAQGQYEQAVRYLESYLARNEARDPLTQRLLGAAQLKLDRPKRAVEALEAAAQDQSDDVALLATIGAAAARAGNLSKSSIYYEKAVDLDPENARNRASLGVTRIAAGETDRGIEDLEKAVETDPGMGWAEKSLILNLIRAKRFDDALAASKRLQERDPDDSTGYNFAGLAYVGMGKMAEARAAFQGALERKPGATDAAANMAALEFRSGNPDKARELYREILQHHPRHFRTLSALGELEFQQGNRSAAIEWLAKAVEIDPNALGPSLILSRLLLQSGKPDRALAISEAAAKTHRNDPALLEVIGKSQMANGRPADAVSTFRSLSSAQPKSAEAKYLLATAYAGVREWNGAHESLKEALALDPGHGRAKVALADILLRQDRLDEAGQIIDGFSEAENGSPLHLLLRGRLALKRGHPREAIEPLEKAYEIDPSSELTVLLGRAFGESGNRAAMFETYGSWLQKHPDDLPVRLQRANLHLVANETDKAKSEYRAILEHDPDNWLVLNNLAGVLNQEGNNAEALPYAARAYKIAPTQPAVLDTYGMVLLGQGDSQRAALLLREAYDRAPHNPQLTANLATALKAADRTEEARRLVQQELSGAPSQADRDALQKLLQQLEQ